LPEWLPELIGMTKETPADETTAVASALAVAIHSDEPLAQVEQPNEPKKEEAPVVVLELTRTTKQSFHARALLAIGADHGAIVLATDNGHVAKEIDRIGDCASDLGIVQNQQLDVSPGLYLWQGQIEVTRIDFVDEGTVWDTQFEPTVFAGELTQVTSKQLHLWEHMTPQADRPVVP
jgi:hypothetical protein